MYVKDSRARRQPNCTVKPFFFLIAVRVIPVATKALAQVDKNSLNHVMQTMMCKNEKAEHMENFWR